MCGTKAFRGLPESDSCVHFRTQARTGVSAPVSPLHLVPTTWGPSACRTQALSCPLPVCSTASPGPRPAPDQPLGAAYSAGLSLSPVCASCRSPSISSIPAHRFTSFALSGIQTPILCQGFHDIHLFITPSRLYQNREGKYVIQRGLFSTEINISGDRHPRLVYRECNADGVGRNPARSAYPAHLSRQRSIPDRRAGRLEAEAPLGKLGLTGPCAAAAGRPSA